MRELDTERRIGAVLRRAGHAALFVLVLAACETFAESRSEGIDRYAHDPRPTGGAAGAGGSSVIIIGSTGSGGFGACRQAETPVFADQVVSHDEPAHRELYSWTVPEHITELRRDQILLIRSEQEGMGRGNAFNVIDNIALGITPQAQLAKKLSEEIFLKIRYAWPHPWATRLGWPGESYGNQLVRIVLKDEAWVARVMQGTVEVFDMQNRPVPIEEAVLHADRVAAIYFVNDSNSGGPFCGGTFSSGSGGYREFIIGNEAMVAEWSVATQQIRDRIEDDAERATTFLERVRTFPPLRNTGNWNADVVCGWEQGGGCGDVGMYELALAMPSDNYFPEMANVAALADTLRADLFDPDPLVVVPGE